MCALASGCAAQDPPRPATTPTAQTAAGVSEAEVSAALARGLAQIEARAEAVVEAMKPVPLLRTREVRALQRIKQSTQRARAERLGIQPGSDADAALASGRLVRLDSTATYTVRALDHSAPYVTPGTKALVEAIGRRFQSELEEYGLPAYRLEISSALRTPETQADLRESNSNAARTTSTHEYGVSVDLAYESFAAPLAPTVALDLRGAEFLEPHLRRVEARLLERAAAQKSRELQAILGRLLAEMQEEGSVMVTLEIRQPVYHLTLAR